jgi:hypothetical protein
MTFKCDICEETSKPHEKMVKIPTQTRQRIYELPSVPTGWEIVKELQACKQCEKETNETAA